MKITEQKFLEILDAEPDGFIAPEWSCFAGYDPSSVIRTGFELVSRGVLRVRDCMGLAFERNN